MTRERVAPAANPGNLIDFLLKTHELKNDAALSRALGLPPPVISKIRSGSLGVGATTILLIHEKFGMAVADIRKVIAS